MASRSTQATAPADIAPKPARLRFVGMIAAAIVALATYFLFHIDWLGNGPLFVEVPATAPPARAQAHVAAVLFSGDMGFKMGLGPRIARRLAADGIPLVAVSTPVFFRTRRTPAEAEKLVEQAIRRALELPQAERVVLVGQSFGADMLQVGLAGLPPPLRSKIALVALVVPGDTVDFDVSPAEFLGLRQPDAPALPTAERIDWAPLLCIYGLLETDSLCPHLAMPNAQVVGLPGGHPLKRDADAVHAQLLAAIRLATGGGDRQHRSQPGPRL